MFNSIIVKFFATLCMSMIPVVELRGGIPFGLGIGLSPIASFIASVFGNLLPVPFIILLIRKIFDWLRRSEWWAPKIERLEHKAHLNGRLVKKYRLIGLIILVAIPLPGTGAWTGALVAAILDIRLKHALPAIFLGVVIAGTIVLGVSLGVIAFLI